jgi:hypothetical protein
VSGSSITHEAKRMPQWFDDLPDLLDRALDRYDPQEHGDFDELQGLASKVIVGKKAVRGEFSVISEDCWIAPGSISVTLIYEGEGGERAEVSDSFPIRVHYTVSDHKVDIKKIELDLTSLDE